MSILPNISRRSFLAGTAATAAGAAVVSVLSSCSKPAETTSDPVVVDSGTATYVVGSGDIEGSYSQAEDGKGTTSLAEAGSWNLPLGCTLRPSEGSWKPYVVPSQTPSAMTSAGAISVASGANVVLVDVARTGGNFVIYDAQCSDSVFAWSELDIVSHEWRLFAASLADGALGTVNTLWKADADYDPPLVCCSGSSVIWLVMPSTSGSKTRESSSCYLWQAGASSADEVVRSSGRFACAPTVSDGNVTLVPRVRANEGRYFGITAYTLESGLSTQVNQLVLPASVSPMYATFMDGNFVFSIEANYGTGGLLGNMGTYIGSGDGSFVALPREPAAVCAGKGGVYLIKTRAGHVIVDTNAQTYATLAAPSRALDYGDYPASMGTTSTFVTFATVKDEQTGYPASVQVRAWTL